MSFFLGMKSEREDSLDVVILISSTAVEMTAMSKSQMSGGP